MEKNKIILLNLAFSSLFLLLAVGYFELRFSGSLKTSSSDNFNPQNIVPDQGSSSSQGNGSNDGPEPAYETPKELSFSGNKVPGYASGEIISINDTELVLKQSASIELKYQIARKDVEKITEITVTGSRQDPKKEPKIEEVPSDWSKIQVGSKINMRLDENQKRIISIIILKGE